MLCYLYGRNSVEKIRENEQMGGDKMTEQEKRYFDALVESKSKIADALNDPAAEGIKDNAVFKEPLNKSHMLSKALSPGIF